MATPNISEIATATIRHHARDVADNITNNNALLAHLKKRGRVKPYTGGTEIKVELSYQENSTYKRYSGYEPLDIQPSEVLTSATYGVKQSAVSITISGEEEIANAGKSKMLDLLDERITAAQSTMANNLSADIYSDGTEDDGKQINGLAALISTTPNTGTVGNIPRASWGFWRNKVKTAAVLSDVKQELQKMWLQLVRGTDKPGLIVMDNEVYSAYWGDLQDQQRYASDTDTANMGFENLLFNRTPVVLDGGHGGNAPEKRCYFINTKYLMWKPHSERNPMTTDMKAPVNQDALVSQLLWAGNLCMNNASLQGVIQFA